MIDVNLQFTSQYAKEEEWRMLAPAVQEIHARLHKGSVPGSDFLGWIHLPSQTLEDGLEPILNTAAQIRETSDAVVVVGIGGSYLGARAAFEWVKPEYVNQLSATERRAPELYFAGNHISSSALQDLLRVLEGKRVSLIVISKSGTTTEPAVAFRLLRAWLNQQLGVAEAKKRIFVITDKAKGALKQLANQENYQQFVIPDDVGGRYSVLTPVGLLPLASVNVDVRQLLEGAMRAEQSLANSDLDANPAYRYAAVRNVLYRRGKTTEVLAYYEPSLKLFAEWWKQLFGESEGKDGKGIYPASVGYTTDLHSMGQYIQEGFRNLFETVVEVEKPVHELTLPSDPQVEDGLEYLAGKPLAWINHQAQVATQLAHADGGVPNIGIRVKDRTESSLGELFYFFELACACSGLLLGVNPFDQPGVEAYKVNMFALLGKPGFETHRQAIEGRLRK